MLGVDCGIEDLRKIDKKWEKKMTESPCIIKLNFFYNFSNFIISLWYSIKRMQTSLEGNFYLAGLQRSI